MRRFVCSTALAAVLCIASTPAAWSQCPDPVDRIITFPEDGSNDVPVNAVLHIDFPNSQAPSGAPTWLVLDSGGHAVAGSEEWDGLTSTFTPTGGFEQRSAYYARVSVAATGQFLNVAFNTGSGSDREAPEFSGLSGLSWEYRTESWLLDECRIWRGDALIYRLEFNEARDDEDQDHLCYYVYQTAGPGISSPTLVARVRYPGDDLHLLLPTDTGEGEICYRVEVRDIAGRFDGNRRERCVEAVVGAVFDDACSATAGRQGGNLPLLLLVTGALAWVTLRRSRRS